MKSLVPAVAKFAAISVVAVALSTAARSADLSEPMILVASTSLDGSPFERTSRSGDAVTGRCPHRLHRQQADRREAGGAVP